jgi:hypothetical protein
MCVKDQRAVPVFCRAPFEAVAFPDGVTVPDIDCIVCCDHAGDDVSIEPSNMAIAARGDRLVFIVWQRRAIVTKI